MIATSRPLAPPRALRFVLALTLGLFLNLAARAAETVRLDGAAVGQWTMDYDSALKLAKDKDLPLLLDFTGSDWCGWCKVLEEKVFSQAEWQKFAKDRLLLVTLDFPKNVALVPEKYRQRNETLQQAFGIEGFPTLMVLDADGKTVLGQLGINEEVSAASFIADVRKTLRLRPVEIGRAVAKLGPAKGKEYQDAIKEFKEAIRALDAWLQTEPRRTEENTKRFLQMRGRIAQAEAQIAKLAPSEP